MSKQDRQGVRTAAELERKYPLGQTRTAQGESKKQELAIAQLAQTMSQYMAANNGNIDKLSKDIDKLNKDTNGSFEELNGTIDDLNEEIDELNKRFDDMPDNPGGSGTSPTIDVADIDGGHRVTITDAEGTESFDVMDGKNGSDGEDGYTPVKGVDYFDGEKGDPGSDAEVTKNNVITALGYTPADASLYVEDTTYPGCYYRMVSGVKEWVNPPMVLGTEYRTTKRHKGKVVYSKAVNGGALPNKSSKTVAISAKTPNIVSVHVMISNGTYSTELPFVSTSGTVSARFFISSSGNCTLHTFSDESDYSAEIHIEYTK